MHFYTKHALLNSFVQLHFEPEIYIFIIFVIWTGSFYCDEVYSNVNSNSAHDTEHQGSKTKNLKFFCIKPNKYRLIKRYNLNSVYKKI